MHDLGLKLAMFSYMLESGYFLFGLHHEISLIVTDSKELLTICRINDSTSSKCFGLIFRCRTLTFTFKSLTFTTLLRSPPEPSSI